MSAPAVAGLAEAYLALEARLRGAYASIDPSWLARLLPCAPDAAWLQADAPAARDERLAHGLFTRVCGPWPALAALATPAGRWSLHPRDELLPRLAAYALLHRPGVLRSCVQRASRQAFEALLGPAFEPAQRAALGGRAMPAALGNVAPSLWAAVGYVDLTRCGVWPERSMRRLVRLALPADVPRLALRVAGAAGLPLGVDTAPGALDSAERGMACVDRWFAAQSLTAAS